MWTTKDAFYNALALIAALHRVQDVTHRIYDEDRCCDGWLWQSMHSRQPPSTDKLSLRQVHVHF